MSDTKVRGSDLLEAIGQSGEVVVRTWTERDVMLYNLAVGAGQEDSIKELHLTTENSPEAELQVLPSFACILSSAPWPEKFAPDMTKVVHVDEKIKVLKPIPTSGTCTAQMTVKGTAAHRVGTVFKCEFKVCDHETEDEIALVEMGLLVREVHLEAHDNDADQWTPEGQPDCTATMHTATSQALLYRLNGDRNPLHSSPEFAKKAGFERPILHGLCTLGISTRLLAGHYRPENTAAVTGVTGSFKKPVFPGDTLIVESWVDDDEVRFRTLNQDGKVVLDLGRLELE